MLHVTRFTLCYPSIDERSYIHPNTKPKMFGKMDTHTHTHTPCTLTVRAGAAAGGEVLGAGPPPWTCDTCGNRADPMTLSGWWGSRGHTDPRNFWTRPGVARVRGRVAVSDRPSSAVNQV